jgi:ferredoxin
MPTVKADFEACQGYANCVAAASDVFDIDDDGIVILLRAEAPEQERPRFEEAVRSCPMNALTLLDQ